MRTLRFRNEIAKITRGWTLQELLAPRYILFFPKDGFFTESTDHQRSSDPIDPWEEYLHLVTGIDIRAPRREPLSSFSTEQRFPWAAARRTKRPEDEAYSLLGIFGVRMRLDYGEGREAAFQPLTQENRKDPQRETHFVNKNRTTPWIALGVALVLLWMFLAMPSA